MMMKWIHGRLESHSFDLIFYTLQALTETFNKATEKSSYEEDFVELEKVRVDFIGIIAHL